MSRVLRVVVPVVAVCLALASCGGGREDGLPTSGSSPSNGRSDGQGPSGPKAAAPGVPVSKHGDNSIQTWGLEATPGQRAQVAAFVQEYLDARAAREWGRACNFLAAEQRREHERIGQGAACGKAMGLFASHESAQALGEAAEIEVFSLRVGGGHAFVIYRRPDEHFYATALTREDGRWRIVTVTPNPVR